MKRASTRSTSSPTRSRTNRVATGEHRRQALSPGQRNRRACRGDRTGRGERPSGAADLNIAAGLGTVTVDGMGTLIAVELDSDAVETQTEASLARQVLCAINDAESAALTRRDAMIAEAEKEAGRR
jgi:hypothetical protein